MIEPIWTTREVAERFGLSQDALRKAIQRGLLPAYRHGRRLYVTEAAVREYRERKGSGEHGNRDCV